MKLFSNSKSLDFDFRFVYYVVIFILLRKLPEIMRFYFGSTILEEHDIYFGYVPGLTIGLLILYDCISILGSIFKKEGTDLFRKILSFLLIFGLSGGLVSLSFLRLFNVEFMRWISWVAFIVAGLCGLSALIMGKPKRAQKEV